MPEAKKEAPPQGGLPGAELPVYDLPNMRRVAGGPGRAEIKAVQDSGDEDGDSPPGR